MFPLRGRRPDFRPTGEGDKMKNIEIYSKEVECIYKDEKYSVRDNGAVMRHMRDGKRIRKDDNIWSFGKLNTKYGFMEIGGKRIHRIVAIAFLGNPPTKQHVVTHVDTDKRNNRSENLRWVTKFENTILTPHNCEKIRNICGIGIEEILKNVKILQDIDLTINFSWIKIINQDEATLSYKHLLEIANIDKHEVFSSLDEWLIHRYEIQNRVLNDNHEEKSYIKQSLTKNAIQVKWAVPSEFPCCPQGIVDNPIIAYFENLNKGSIFCINNYYQRNVLDTALSEDKKTVFISSESIDLKNAVKPWALAKVTYENSTYVHYNLGSYFAKNGVEKYFCLAQGKKWTGGDSIDDYC